MHQILKRLELIKTSIAIEDEEIIELQVNKLVDLNIDEEVHHILQKLQNNDFGSVVVDIENYMTKFSGMVVYEDKELDGLKFELKVLEKSLQDLSEEKNEYVNDINEFNIEYNLHLGNTIRNILELRKEILYFKTTQQNSDYRIKKDEYKTSKDELDELMLKIEKLKKELNDMDPFDEDYDDIFEELKKVKGEYREIVADIESLETELAELAEELDDDEYQEAKEDFEEFDKEFEEIIHKERFELDEDEFKELKQAYRKAAKICHPDIVSDELKARATVMIQELNEAYEKKDLEKVRSILLSLESGNGFDVASDTILDKDKLKEKIAEVRQKVNEILQEIDELKNDETYQTIQNIDDLDEYFEELKYELEEEQDRLQAEIENMSNIQHTKQKVIEIDSEDADEDDFWSSEF